MGEMKKIEFDFENVGGLCEIYAVPKGCFRKVGHDWAKGTRTAYLRNREQIIAIPMWADDTFQFVENKDESDGGTYYDVLISGIIPKQEATNEHLVEELERGEWVVLSRDNNGIIRLSGSDEVPLRFNSQKDTGVAFASRNGIGFTFTGKQPVGSIIVDAARLSEV